MSCVRKYFEYLGNDMLKAISLSFLLSVHVMHELGKQQTVFSASSLLKVSRSLRVPVKAEVVYIWP